MLKTCSRSLKALPAAPAIVVPPNTLSLPQQSRSRLAPLPRSSSFRQLGIARGQASRCTAGTPIAMDNVAASLVIMTNQGRSYRNED